jgi:hypothetical protein
MLQRVVHASHLLLTLQPFPMLAANIARDGIEDALKSVGSGDLAELFQFQKEKYGVCLDFFESQPSSWIKLCMCCCMRQTELTIEYPRGDTQSRLLLLNADASVFAESAHIPSRPQECAPISLLPRQ